MKAEAQLEELIGSQLPAKLPQVKLDPLTAPNTGGDVDALPDAFTAVFTKRFHGQLIGIGVDPRITANSSVVLAMSEFGGTPQQRFIGSARMDSYNIAPFDGGFEVWCEVFWGADLNIRFDVFVNP